jgi:hypothetical protein
MSLGNFFTKKVLHHNTTQKQPAGQQTFVVYVFMAPFWRQLYILSSYYIFFWKSEIKKKSIIDISKYHWRERERKGKRREKISNGILSRQKSVNQKLEQ